MSPSYIDTQYIFYLSKKKVLLRYTSHNASAQQDFYNYSEVNPASSSLQNCIKIVPLQSLCFSIFNIAYDSDPFFFKVPFPVTNIKNVELKFDAVMRISGIDFYKAGVSIFAEQASVRYSVYDLTESFSGFFYKQDAVGVKFDSHNPLFFYRNKFTFIPMIFNNNSIMCPLLPIVYRENPPTNYYINLFRNFHKLLNGVLDLSSTAVWATRIPNDTNLIDTYVCFDLLVHL